MNRTSCDRFLVPIVSAAAALLWTSGCGSRIGPETQTGTTPSGTSDSVGACDRNTVPFGGGSGVSSNPYRLCSRTHWISMAAGETLGKYFRVVEDIDFQNKSAPLVDEFRGTLDGGGEKLRNLSGSPLFVQLSGSVRNLHLENFDVVGGNNVGALAGIVTAAGLVEDVTASGTVVGSFNAGGLVGVNSGTLRRVDAAVNVRGNTRIGGIAGIHNGQLESSYAHGIVTGVQLVGGLVGTLGFGGHVEKVVVGPSQVSASSEAAGGIAGDTGASTVIADAVALADVSGGSKIGGVVGSHAGTAARVLAAGTTDGDAMCGQSSGTWSAGFFDTTKSGMTTSTCGEGKTTSELYVPGTYVGWDVLNVWLVNGVAYPTLR